MGLQFGPGVDFKALKAAVATHVTVENSAIALINGIADNIAIAIQRADANTQSQLNELVAELEKETKNLTDAVVSHRPLAAATLDQDTAPVVAQTLPDNPMLSAPTPSIPDDVLHAPSHVIVEPVANVEPVFVEPTPPGEIVVPTPEPEPVFVKEPIVEPAPVVVEEPIVVPEPTPEPVANVAESDPVTAPVEPVLLGPVPGDENPLINSQPFPEPVAVTPDPVVNVEPVANTEPTPPEEIVTNETPNTLSNPPVFFNQLVHDNITEDLKIKGLIA